jgi:hypothetical protein
MPLIILTFSAVLLAPPITHGFFPGENPFDPTLCPSWLTLNSQFDFNHNGSVGIDDFILFQVTPSSHSYLRPAAEIHDGSVPGAPQGTITPDGHLDISGMSPGDLVVFDFCYEYFSYTLAGFEFRIDFPPGILSLSEDDLDWQLGQGSVVTPGAFMTGNFQQLPANSQGVLNASQVDNENGHTRVGFVYYDIPSRPIGTPELPNPGGKLVRIHLEIVELPTPGPNAFSEKVSVFLTFDANEPGADLFANSIPERELVSPVPAAAQFGLNATGKHKERAAGKPSQGSAKAPMLHLLEYMQNLGLPIQK